MEFLRTAQVNRGMLAMIQKLQADVEAARKEAAAEAAADGGWLSGCDVWGGGLIWGGAPFLLWVAVSYESWQADVKSATEAAAKGGWRGRLLLLAGQGGRFSVEARKLGNVFAAYALITLASTDIRHNFYSSPCPMCYAAAGEDGGEEGEEEAAGEGEQQQQQAQQAEQPRTSLAKRAAAEPAAPASAQGGQSGASSESTDAGEVAVGLLYVDGGDWVCLACRCAGFALLQLTQGVEGLCPDDLGRASLIW